MQLSQSVGTGRVWQDGCGSGSSEVKGCRQHPRPVSVRFGWASPAPGEAAMGAFARRCGFQGSTKNMVRRWKAIIFSDGLMFMYS